MYALEFHRKNKMINSKKLKKLLFFFMFLNCCIVMSITSISLSTDCWVLARPYRKQPLFDKTTKSFSSEYVSNKTSDEDHFLAASSVIDEDSILLPLDISYYKNDCKRFNGKIRFGLFKGIWVLNYAYGCKNRVNRISMIDTLSKHKLFDQTLWISTILCCSLAIIAAFISSLFCLFNIFLTPEESTNPISLYLWNSISAIFHFLAIVLFAVEYHVYIKHNVLTKDELESGWVSNNRAQLGWSYYLLISSLLFIALNICAIYIIASFKKTSINLNNEIRMKSNDRGLSSDFNYECSIDEIKRTQNNNTENSNSRNEYARNVSRESNKLKKIIDFAY